MPVLRFQCRLPRDSGVPADDCVNVWTFDTDQTIEEDADDIAGRLVAFYNAIETLLASTLTGAVNIKVYDLAVAQGEREPVYETSGTFQPNVSALPAELAIVGTLLAGDDTGEAIPIKYRRGRVYLGPLSTAAAQGTAGGDVVVEAAERAVIGNALVALCTGPDAGDGRLAVYSPTWHLGRGPTSGGRPGGPGPLPALDAHSLDSAVNDVTRIQVDNALDIQRRRGAAATVRQTFLVP